MYFSAEVTMCVCMLVICTYVMCMHELVYVYMCKDVEMSGGNVL